MAGPVEHPIVSARVLPPDAFRVCENQQPGLIGRQGIAVDGERLTLTGWDQVRGGDQDLAFAISRVVADQLPAAAGTFRRFQRRIHGAGSGGQPLNRHRLWLEFVRAEDPLDRQPGGIFLLSSDQPRGWDRNRENRNHAKQTDHQISSGSQGTGFSHSTTTAGSPRTSIRGWIPRPGASEADIRPSTRRGAPTAVLTVT